MLLALEPRMVFDASVAAVADAAGMEATDIQPAFLAEAHDTSSAPEPVAPPAVDTAEKQPGDKAPASESSRAAFLRSGIGPQLDSTNEWSEAPQIDFTGTFTVNEDDTLSFGTNGLKLTDSDSTDVVITISVEHGSLELSYVPGVVGNTYTWNADHTQVSFEADIETAQKVLNTLKYKPAANYNGTDTLTVLVSDEYSGNAETAFSKDISITPVADAPNFGNLFSGKDATKPYEDKETLLLFNYGTADTPVWESLKITDPDSADDVFNDTYDLTLTITKGTLSSTFNSLSLGAGSKSGDKTTYSLSGLSLSEVNGILAGLKFTGDHNYFGAAELSVSVDDSNASGILNETFQLDVLPQNDAPTLAPPTESDTGKHLSVDELVPNADGNYASDAEGILNLGHFHTDWNATDHTPTNNGNDPLPLFDVDNNLHQLVVKVSQSPKYGDLYRKMGGEWVKLGVGGTFSLWDVYSGNVKYVHNPDHQVSSALDANSEHDSFSFTLNDGVDGSQDGVIHIKLNPVNQPPQVVVKPNPDIGLTDDRFDHSWVRDPITNELELVYTVWGYEGEQGIPFSFDIIDADQATGSDFTVQFKTLPPASQGYFWYNDGTGYVKVTAGMEMSLALIRGNPPALIFCHSGVEDCAPVAFEITVTDDGGGLGAGGARSIDASLKINIRANNDHPEWNTGVIGSIWDDNQHEIACVDQERTIVLDNSVFNVKDIESTNQSVTYTITDINGDAGSLYYRTEISPGNFSYRAIGKGEKITQADIDSNKIIWMFNGTGNKSVDLSFIVRDGCTTACPVPPDSINQAGGVEYPYGGPSKTGWENGAGLHEGGIGTWLPINGNPENGYEWVLTQHTLTITATNLQEGASPPLLVVRDPIPEFGGTATQNVVEGQWTEFTPGMLDAWFYPKGESSASADRITDYDTYTAARPENLTYRIESVPASGWVLFKNSDGSYRVLGVGGSFSQADVIAGNVFYLHNGGEATSDSFQFSLSDGRSQVKNSEGDTSFTQQLSIASRNDGPTSTGGDPVIVNEHDLSANASADKTTSGGETTITTDHIKVSDRDTGSLASNSDQIYIIITDLPTGGTLYLNGTAVVPVDPADLQAIKDGGGYSTWAGDAAISDKSFTVIKLSDIISGKLTYKHNGQEAFFDEFSYLVSDNRGVAAQNADHNCYQLIDGQIVLIDRNQGSVSQYKQTVEIKIQPVNDRPEATTSTPDHIQVLEGGEIVINKTLGGSNATHISYADPDSPREAIQFTITTPPEYGVLLLNGKVLEAGGSFTQADIDAGRLVYKHNDTENHSDTFKCRLSDSIFTSADDSEVFSIEIIPQNDQPTLSTPDDFHVESIAPGIILDIEIADPDVNERPSYPGSGIVDDIMTIDLFFTSSKDSGGFDRVDLSKLTIAFKDSATFTLDDTTPGLLKIRLTGTYAFIKNAVSKIYLGTQELSPGNQYDPDGDIKIAFELHDGEWDAVNNKWIRPNGGGDVVLLASEEMLIYISPVNDPPQCDNSASDLHMTVYEDQGYVAVKDANGDYLQISDPDAFKRGNNSIEITVDNGILLVSAINGPRITGNGTSTLTITGTLDHINTVLKSLQYKANTNYNGTDTLNFVYKDRSNTGETEASWPLESDSAYKGLYNEVFRYDTGLKEKDTNNTIYGLGIKGSMSLTISAVNDAPTVDMPDELYIQNEYTFDGVAEDVLGNKGLINVDDVDIDQGSYTDNILTVTISVDDGATNHLGGTLGIGTDSNSLIQSQSGTQIVLKGTREQINEFLKTLTFEPANWTPDTYTLTVTVSDPGTSTGTNGNPNSTSSSNGAEPNNNPKSTTKTITIHCSDRNDTPTISAPPALTVPDPVTGTDTDANWVIKEDAAASNIFQGITLSDNDSFDGQVFVAMSVSQGEIVITDAAKAYLKLSGNPSLQDGITLSADKKTVYIKGSLAKIEQVLAALNYKGTANWNGDVAVNIYVNDLGYTGLIPLDTGEKPDASVSGIPTTGVWADVGNKLGMASSGTYVLRINAVNDAPTWVSGTTNVDFSGSAPNLEDSAASDVTVKTVNDLFASVFKDDTDNQSANTHGSSADSLAGIVITKNNVNSAHGSWEYYNSSTSTWVKISTSLSATNALYLSKDTQLRFVPAADFNGTPGTLVVHLVDNSPVVAANSQPTTLPADYSTFNFTAAGKGGETRYSNDAKNLVVTVKAVNDAPVVNSNTSTTLPAVAEDSASPAGDTVANLFGPSFSDAKDTVTPSSTGGSSANSLAGVVIVGDSSSSAQGVWQYYNGSSWQAISNVSESNGLFLTAGTKIRFLPAADYNGTPGGLTVRLVDNSTVDSTNPALTALPAAYGRVDLSTSGKTGGTTRYSSGTVALGTSITAVNDAPAITGTGGVSMPGINEDTAAASNSGATVDALFNGSSNGRFSDARDDTGESSANAFGGILITGNAASSAQGVWQYSTNGSTWVDIPASFTSGTGLALQEGWFVRFQPAADFNGTPGSLTVHLIDKSATATGNPAADYGNVATISGTGGITRYSQDSLALGISVAALNDAPKIASGKGSVVKNHTEDSTTQSTVGGLFAESFTDSADQSSGSNANAFAGIIITQNNATAAQGVWYYEASPGNWVAISTSLSATGGLYLAKDTALKFVPTGDYNGSVGTLEARLVENGGTALTQGTTYDVTGTNSGGQTRISAGAVTVSGQVQAVNDAPVATTPGTAVTVPAINEDIADASNSGSTVSSLIGSRFDDSKDTVTGGTSANTLAGVIIKSLPDNLTGKGVWQYYTGSAWAALQAGMFIQEGTAIRFSPVANFNGPVSGPEVYLVERTGAYAGTLPASGSTADSSTRGGSSPISADALRLALTVNAVNDAPGWKPEALGKLPDNPSADSIYYGQIAPTGVPGSDILESTVRDVFASAMQDYLDAVSGGSNANGLGGILVTNVPSSTLGQWEYYNGSSWQVISGVSESNALFLSADTQIRFVHDTNYPPQLGTISYASMDVALVDSSNASGTLAAGSFYNATTRGGTTAISDGILPLWVNVYPSNNYPVFTTPPANITTGEREQVQLSDSVDVADYEMDHIVSSNWDGATVTIERAGGANADDVFTALSGSGLAGLPEGGRIIYGGTDYGQVLKNGDGTLSLQFNNAATANDVNNVLRSIGYTNSSYDPPASVQLEWRVDDGNVAQPGGYPPQGLNHAGDTSGSASFTQVVRINPVNDAPIAEKDENTISTNGYETATGNVLDNDWDWDTPHDQLTVIGHTPPTYGALVINPDGSYTYTVDPANPHFNDLAPGETLLERVEYTVSDGSLSSTAYLEIVIEKAAPDAVIPPPEGDSMLIPEAPRDSAFPDVPHDLETDKPVVREVEEHKNEISASIRDSMDMMHDVLDHMGNYDEFGIRLVGSMDQQAIYTGRSQTINIPSGLFRHSKAGEELDYMITLEDGSPLPPWLSWNKTAMTLSGTPLYALDAPLVVKITASDHYNNQASAYFRLDVLEGLLTEEDDISFEPLEFDDRGMLVPNDGPENSGNSAKAPAAEADTSETDSGEKAQPEPNAPETDASEQEALSGAPSFTEQLAANGQSGIFAMARESLRNLM